MFYLKRYLKFTYEIVTILTVNPGHHLKVEFWVKKYINSEYLFKVFY